MPANYARFLTGRRRSVAANRQLGWVLAFVAGAINAGGFLAVGQYTSHMTGVVSGMADALVLGHTSTALVGLAMLLAFVTGAMCTALLVNWGIKPFTMLGIATLFLGVFFKDLLPGTEVVKDGSTVELYRSYIAGAILLGILSVNELVA